MALGRNRRWVRLIAAACVAAWLVLPAWAQDTADVTEVTVTGEGISEDAARNDALRKALEQGAGVEISSHSQVENFELIRDTIYARADGLVSDYKILEQGMGVGGVYFMKIRALVKRSSVAAAWGDVQNVLDQLGRPGVAIYIVERIDGQVQDSSIIESMLEKRLLEKGFVVYAGEQIRAIAEKEMADAESEANVAKMQSLAKRFGTQIFVSGTSQASAAGVSNLAGQNVAMYNGDAMIKMFYTDTARLLASESLTNARGGARGYFEHSPQAGKKALANAAETDGLIDSLFNSVMARWSEQISYGGELELEIEGLSMVQAIKIKKKLAEIPKVERVNGPEMSKGIARFRILAKMTAEQMVEHLVDPEWEKMMEVVDLKMNRIQAKAVGE